MAKLEQAIDKLADELNVQAGDVVALATGFARTDNRVFPQNLDSAVVHMARQSDDGYTACGWRYATARHGRGPGHRLLRQLNDLPGSLLCEKCLPTERAIAMAVLSAELSGDEL